MLKNFLRQSCPLLIMTLSVTFFAGACAWAQPDNNGRLVGGPCQYKSYPGQATIVSIVPYQEGKTDNIERYEVRFSFTPRQKIEDGFARVEGKTFHLYGDYFQYPDKNFLIRNNIQVGKVLEGRLQAITSGTCTPVLFDFPDLKKQR
jgi:hypothetical protein